MLKKQSGAVLLISLIILIILTILILSSTQSTLMQEKMTASTREGHVSLEVAESGIRDAENMIEALTNISGFSGVGTGGRYSEGNGPVDLFNSAVWLNGVTSEAGEEISGERARYFVEFIGLNDSVSIFKIVSRSAIGANNTTERVIVSYYGKVF